MATSSGDRDPISGRFLRNNQAARKTGLRSNSRADLQRQNRRSRGYMARLVNVLAQAGRPLEAQHLPMAKKWAELEVLRVDYFNALQAAATERDSKLVEQYLSVCRLQVAVEKELKMTPAVKLGMEPDDPVSQIVRYRQQLALEAAKANGS